MSTQTNTNQRQELVGSTTSTVVDSAIAYDFKLNTPKPNGKQNRPPRKPVEEIRKSMLERLNKAIARDGGKFVCFERERGVDTYGLLIGGVDLSEGSKKKFSFLYIDKDRNILLEPMTTSYRMAHEAPGYLSVLNYLYRYQKKELRDLVEDWLERNRDCTLVTSLDTTLKVLSPKKKKFGNNKKGEAKKDERPER